jgi:hypothetical protein
MECPDFFEEWFMKRSLIFLIALILADALPGFWGHAAEYGLAGL